MNHSLTISLARLCFYFAITLWLALTLILFVSVVKRKWSLFKRTIKYLINSSAFLITFSFYLEMALVVRPPVEAEELLSWANQHVAKDLGISIFFIITFFILNYIFYTRIENRKHKIDLLFLAIADSLILTGGAWLAGQDAYYGLLEELHRI